MSRPVYDPCSTPDAESHVCEPVPVEHNSDGPPCTLTITDAGVGDRQRAVDTASWLAAICRDNNKSCPTRDAAHKAYDAVLALSKLL